jgi:UDP-N-acetylmuramoylalanine--D-glutamate ligase
MRENIALGYKDKHILVLGLAKSGVAVAKLLSRLGATVVVNEKKERKACSNVEELEELGVTVVCGEHPLELLHSDLYLIVKNPGIPYDIPFLQQAEKQGIPVVTEIELAYQITDSPIIGITGSNGKTTTTTLINEMLQGSNREPKIAGNIGTVMCEVAEKSTESNWLVAELSSFQLLGTMKFKPKISLILNIYDAHLDYHHTKDHYITSKSNIFRNQTENDITVLNYDLAVTRAFAGETRAEVVWFSFKSEVPRGTFIRDGHIVHRNAGGDITRVLDSGDIKLVGEHNLENVLAAVSVSLEAGASLGHIQEVLRTFEGVPHRLQHIRTFQNVRYYNDSKATNSVATKKSIQAFQEPIVLIAGGLDRGDDFLELQDVFDVHLTSIVAYGQSADKILAVGKLAGVKHLIRVDNVEEAVQKASEIAQSGDIVLLSPAAASWDQFASFEERGDMFTQSVHKLR